MLTSHAAINLIVGWVSYTDLGDIPEQQSAVVPTVPPPFRDKTTILTILTLGAAVSTFTGHRCFNSAPDTSAQRQDITNRYHIVSEKLTPDVNLSRLYAAYEPLPTTVASFDIAVAAVSPNAVHIIYLHKHGCQKCARAVKIRKRLEEKSPYIVVEQCYVKTESMLYEVPQTKRCTTRAVFIGDTALIGEVDEQHLKRAVQKRLPTRGASRLEAAAAQLDTAEPEIVKRSDKQPCDGSTKPIRQPWMGPQNLSVT